jgi:hypothetical protein
MKPLLTAAILFLAHYHIFAQEPLAVKPTDDFTVDGGGTNPAWAQTSWLPLNQLDAGVEGYDTKVKILYSGKGIYVLFSGIDKKITSNYYNDFDDMYNADVFEVFFHPEPQTPVYFEYEINAYDKELVLLIPNLDGKIMGWRPWHYEGERKVQHRIRIQEDASGMQSWTAECFFPYSLLAPLQKTPPVKGMVWNANFCRLDYDPGKMIKWSWSPVKASFHEFKVYRQIRFD